MTPPHPHPFDPVPWMDDASCAQVGGDIWFPTGPPARTPMLAAEAKTVCRACPVIADCAAYALARPQLEGIWGGMSESDRKQIRAKARLKGSR